MKVRRTEDIDKVDEMCADHPHINEPTENIEERDFFVLENREKTIGCGYIRSFLGKVGTIGALFISKGRRREGFGSYLVEKLEDEHERESVWFILIGVHKDNKVGFDFWRENGYEVAIDSVNEPLTRNPVDLGILKKTSPVPLPDERVSILVKVLRELEFDSSESIPDEINDLLTVLEDSLSHLNVRF